MKKLLTISFVLIGFASAAQWTPMRQKYQFPGIKITDSLHIPTDTTTNKTGIARIGSTLYAGNGTKWTAAAGSGTTGIDSVTITSTGCVKTFSTWSGGTELVIGTVTQPNGLAPGTGIATKTTGTTFTVTAATYTINCITYQSRDTTITLTAAGDTGRIDVIKVNTSGVTTQGTGTEGEALALPSLSATELALTYVLVTDTGVTVSLPTDTALWVSVGTSIRNANTGPVNVRTSLRVGTYSVPVTDAKIHTDGIIHAAGGVSVDPAVNSATLTGIYPNGSNSGKLMSGNNVDATWGINGTTTRSHFGINGGFNTAAGASGLYSALSISSSIQQAGSPGANTRAYAFQDIGTVINQGTSGTGTIWGTYYHPSITALNGSSHIAYENTSGDIVHRNLAGSGTRMVVVNDSGLLSTQAIPGGGGGSQDLNTTMGIDSATTHAMVINGATLFYDPVTQVYQFGNAAASGNTGLLVVAMGENAALGNSGEAVNAIGTAGLLNAGGWVNAMGWNSTASLNTGDFINAIGIDAAYQNTGDHVNAIGRASANANSGSNVNAFGYDAGASNTHNDVSLFGHGATADSSAQVSFSNGAANLRLDLGAIASNTKLRVRDLDGTIALLSDITGSTSDTIYVDAPLEAYTSGDSNKIRINPDTLAAWRPKYRVYTARISQTGTDAPVEDYVYENTLGAVTWSYDSEGTYYLNSASNVFDSDKTTTIQGVLLGNDPTGTPRYIVGDVLTTDVFHIRVGNSGGLADSILFNYTIEIRVYY